jgi:hypothetical protein
MSNDSWKDLSRARNLMMMSSMKARPITIKLMRCRKRDMMVWHGIEEIVQLF